jgi:hypothetical protein
MCSQQKSIFKLVNVPSTNFNRDFPLLLKAHYDITDSQPCAFLKKLILPFKDCTNNNESHMAH